LWLVGDLLTSRKKAANDLPMSAQEPIAAPAS
jgi:hypothetical protein